MPIVARHSSRTSPDTRRRSRALAGGVVALSLLALGCPADGTASDGVVDSGGTTTSAESGETTAALDSTASTGTVTGADGTQDSGDTGEPCVTEPTQELPSAFEVTIELVNDTGELFHLAAEPMGCSPFDIVRDGESLPLAVGYSCGCECPGPPSATVTTLVLEPDKTHTITWDGRALATYSRSFFCEEDGLCGMERDGSLQPLASGPVTMTIPLFDPKDTAQPEISTLQQVCSSPSSFDVALELDGEDVSVQVLMSTVDLG